VPRVSVIVPAHNAAASLRETLASVAAQSYDGWECIVVDDASDDCTATSAIGVDPRIACVRSDRNLGPAGARNLGLERATGELVAFLDADDLWLPDYLTRQTAAYDAARAAGRRVGVVACDARLLGPDGPLPITYGDWVGRPGRVTLTRLLRSNTIFVSAIAPRALVCELGGFSSECFGSEDHDLWLRMLEEGYEVVYTDEPLAVYRLAESSVSANVLGMARTTQTTYRRALARHRLNLPQRMVARRYLRLQALVEDWETAAAALRAGERRRAAAVALRSLPLLARVVLEHPNRWPRWARLLISRSPSAVAAGRPTAR
jgi:glycosyltransferase involved in cell wall biosynthesis